ncbi:hypothetical protein C8N31_10960 [Sulfitobacter mediterraneus]|uniref:Lipoprotein n=1 Tax=Sulfitobacter mediterraneus TaxID=83219 RepID=A0A2T6CBU0_9RHOB|nr:putative, lipoprotein [Sulfitobacter mediterraneus KCTC 32188]PTX72974.1 hypothetical protein C8N31_10960 [Sulfitobacter mediterraneus]
MKNTISAALIGVVGLAGCAQKAEDVTATYISPMAYQSYSCKQIAQEASRVSGRVGELSGVQNKKASDDAVATGIALVVFWPAAFFIKGDKQTAAELGRLKGELEALEQASIRKKCGIVFKRAVPAEAEKEETE